MQTTQRTPIPRTSLRGVHDEEYQIRILANNNEKEAMLRYYLILPTKFGVVIGERTRITVFVNGSFAKKI
ncbi:hypothetical protein [Fodinibius halophilus]|uniref:Uncharacterized protein n=1 Tax=Fodinibius halophilus TaxID=1736908 RepID=A0A6M1T2D3_9BACT|nr:hypothetical protein [Fodinibius halophilus]NGP90238.1 hypothetical protein [Fodinibius halophilus]